MYWKRIIISIISVVVFLLLLVVLWTVAMINFSRMETEDWVIDPADFREHVEKGNVDHIAEIAAKIPSVDRRQDYFILDFGCKFNSPKKCDEFNCHTDSCNRLRRVFITTDLYSPDPFVFEYKKRRWFYIEQPIREALEFHGTNVVEVRYLLEFCRQFGVGSITSIPEKNSVYFHLRKKECEEDSSFCEEVYLYRKEGVPETQNIEWKHIGGNWFFTER